MHLLKIQPGCYPGQADPFIIKSGGRYYIYVTGHDAIYAYHSDSLPCGWEYHGPVLQVPGLHAFWAPSVIELDGKFYLYHLWKARAWCRIKAVTTVLCMFPYRITRWGPLRW